jgi:uncharacterized protein
MTTTKGIFLKAHWSYLSMFNYEVDPKILKPHLPLHTEIDFFNGKALVSVVGFMFTNTKMLGIKWPWHKNFEEVNLRFYVKHFDGKEWKRGVAFVSEIVPKPAISIIANALYNEHYCYMPMRHKIEALQNRININFEWKQKGTWNNMQLETSNEAEAIKLESEAEFILEHYWGYNQLNKTTTIEYGVEHEKWQIYPVIKSTLNANITQLYGAAFAPFIDEVTPHSVFVAKGSDVVIRKPSKIKSLV